MRDYASFHQNRTNLVIHVFMVPLFVLSLIGSVWALVRTEWLYGALLAAGPTVSLAAQNYGHGKEVNPTLPFSGPGNFVRRILTEQFYGFPSYFVRGGFLSAWRNQKETARDM